MRTFIHTLLIVFCMTQVALAQPGLQVLKGSANTNSQAGGYAWIGNPNNLYLSFDNNELQARNGSDGSILYLNYYGGNVSLVDNAFNTDGGVGIGTLSPSTKLHVIGDEADGTTAALRIQTRTNTAQSMYLDGNEIDAIADGLNLNLNTTQKVTIAAGTDGGDVGLGITNPTAKLHVLANESTLTDNVAIFGQKLGGFANIKLIGNGDASVKFVDEGSGSVGESDFQIRLNSSADLEIRSAENANDEFGTSTLISKFETASDVYQFTVFGDALASGGNFVNSDRRLKQNIEQLDGALEQLMQLQPKRYDYDYNNEKFAYLNLPSEPQIGLIAQEVEEVFPELVKTNRLDKGGKDNDTAKSEELQEVDNLKAVNYVALVPVLIGAVQELNEKTAENETLRSEMDELKAEMAELKAMISALRSGQSVTLEGAKNDNINEARLSQNAPNPFEGKTVINYFIPEESTNAQLRITNATGTVIITVAINAVGEGQLEVDATTLQNGNYFYTLVIDGKIIATKQMLLTK
ncbi:MAG: tail fiber domain-containing protein [Bacteroidota bacterium]